MSAEQQAGRGQFEYMPGRVHICVPPFPGEPGDRVRRPLGTVWKCLVGAPACGRRWRLTYVDDAMGGAPGWVRRYLPWRPILGVEHPRIAAEQQ